MSKTTRDLLLARVDMTAEAPCWRWTGHLTNGYGAIKLPGQRRQGAHRVSYEHFVGPIPDGLQIDHLCRNRACVNPEHLEPVSAAENVRRAFALLQNRCSRGHEFTPGNSGPRPGGGRRCKACQRIYNAKAVAKSEPQRQAARELRAEAERQKWAARRDRVLSAIEASRHARATSAP